jgi:hypothetical protein
LSALFSALAVVSLYIASVWPTGQLGLTAVASLFVAAAVIEMGRKYALYVFIVSAVIAFLIVPNRITPLLFILFFGYYPIIKSIIEKRGKIVVQFFCKLIIFNISLTVTWFLAGELLFELNNIDVHLLFIYIGGNVVFLFFDYGFTKLIRLYINRVSRYIRNR